MKISTTSTDGGQNFGWNTDKMVSDNDPNSKIQHLLPSGLNNSLTTERFEKAHALLKDLTRRVEGGAVERSENAAGRKSFLPSLEAAFPRRSRDLSEAERERFERDGYVILKEFFRAEEVEVLRNCVTEDYALDQNKMCRKDAEGLQTKLTLWWYLGDDTYSTFGSSVSLVHAASSLMQGSEPYHSHSKILLKEPRSGGAWEWHQDFGYWYDQGISQPDKIVSAIIPVDENTRENGCMKLVPGSHKLGRIEHGTFGGQAGADPERVVALLEGSGTSAVPNFEVVNLTISPGDLVFMHSNTLHSSSPNLSDAWRRNLIVVYNSRENEPLEFLRTEGEGGRGQPAYSPIGVVEDAEIVGRGVRGLDAGTSRAMRG